MQDARCRMQTRCARFPVPGSVFGARCPAFGVDSAPVPGPRSQVPDSRYPIPGTRYLAPVFEKPAHGVCRMHDAGCRPGVRVFRCRARSSVLGVRPSALIRYRVPGTRDLEPGTRRLSSKTRTRGMQDKDADLTGAFSGTPARSSVSGLRPWRHEGVKGDATFPRPSSRPGTESRTPNPVPGAWHLGPGPDQRRGPNTEHRRPSRKTRTRGMHPVSCIHRIAHCPTALSLPRF
jgi:hypothetical protein